MELFVKRDDLIHKYISGNKIRKLNQNIFSFYKNKCKKLVTFGGAFSNHLLATAALCNELSIDCVGIVRGEELNENSNGILKKCSSFKCIQLHIRYVYLDVVIMFVIGYKKIIYNNKKVQII